MAPCCCIKLYYLELAARLGVVCTSTAWVATCGGLPLAAHDFKPVHSAALLLLLLLLWLGWLLTVRNRPSCIACQNAC
jgi:hypothetical protein